MKKELLYRQLQEVGIWTLCYEIQGSRPGQVIFFFRKALYPHSLFPSAGFMYWLYVTET